jgi:alkylation response protein AidB-like acyl-CoA dehydrogenase
VNFDFTDEERAFREELRAFIDAELPDWWRGMFVEDPRALPFTREFCKKLAERGWLTMSWPEDYGGRGASVWMQTIVREEMWANEEPRGPQYMNLNYIGPLIMRFGTEEQRRRFLAPMARGEVIWTQGFSEPSAGSDLAALITKAERAGDSFVINGQKIWNSYADVPADWCLLLARTNASVPKHKGISVFLVDMTLPGITVRPIASMAGPHEINEIFFDDVRVPADCLLGDVDGGWRIVTTGLTFERTGVARYAKAGRVIEMLVAYAREAGLADDHDVRQKLADLRVRYEAARLLAYRVVSIQAEGAVPGVEASIARMHGTQLEQFVAAVGLEILGAAAQLKEASGHAPLKGDILRHWLRTIPATITAGTLEVQKNIVAQRGLGLPRAT